MPERSRGSVKSGILWFLAFVLIVLFTAFYSNKNFIEDVLDLKGRSGDSVREVLRNEIVEEESTVIDVIDTVSPGVVSVVVKTVGYDLFSGPFSVEDGVGTGFIVDSAGVVVTNSHVVDQEDGEYSIVLKDGTTYEVNKVHLDQLTDLAILEIEATGLPTISLGDSDNLRVGQTAIAIGNALGKFDNTVTVGVVSGIARELTATSSFGSDPKTYESVIQTDAALNPGNSGGPLLNSAAQVIGINVATTVGAENIGFAIPVNTLKPLLESFLQEGRIVRPYLGVAYTVITEDVATVKRLPEGAFVQQVLRDSPADKAGIKTGDIISKLDGVEVNEGSSISTIVNKRKVGDSIEVELDRGGDILTLTVDLSEAPERF